MKYRDIMLKQLEHKLKLKFNDIELLHIALTHSSFANQKKSIQFNERLEFLGDSVLQLCISELLFKKYKTKPEGELTKIRALIVCEHSLYNISLKWNLGEHINMSRGEELTGGRERVSILADCVEAIIAAIYLDKGYEEAKKFIVDNFSDIIERAERNEIIFDYKTKLQEVLQENGDVDIKYNLTKFEGPPHRRKFYVQVLANKNVIGKGDGFSKKQAEQNAAQKALEILED